MDSQKLIDIAANHLRRHGHSVEDMTAHIERPAMNSTEVLLIDPSTSPNGEVAVGPRVYMVKTGTFLGILDADGTCPKYAPWSELGLIPGEDALDAATRYLRINRIETDGLVPTLVDPIEMTVVWFQRDGNTMGDSLKVCIAHNGTVVRWYRGQ